MRELAPGLWHWQAPHPEWRPRVESHRVVVAGDTIADFGSGLEVSARWLREGGRGSRASSGCVHSSRSPVERVLATHGGPFEPADLERALSSS